MIPDTMEKTIKIPVQWIDGQWQLVGGGALPELSPNTCADLSLLAIALVDDEQRERWTEDQEVDFLAAGSTLFAQVNVNKVPPSLRDKAEKKKHDTGFACLFVRIELQEDVSLSLTPGKKGSLSGGKCVIPAIDSDARSLNEALTKITQIFEPSRRSYGGNVFSRVFYEKGDKVLKLDVLRDRATGAAAMISTRPRDRCDTWLELATTLSRVSEVWNAHQQMVTSERRHQVAPAKQTPLPLPSESSDMLEKAASDFYDLRTMVMIRSDEGLVALLDRFHNRDEKSSDIQQLRELHAAMDRAVLHAYGWVDLAISAQCQFLSATETEKGKYGFNPHSDNHDVRLRWPKDFRAEVLARLLKLDERRQNEESLSERGEASMDDVIVKRANWASE